MSWFTNLLTTSGSTISTILGSLTPAQLRRLGSGVSQAVESQELALLQQIEDNPAQGAGPLSTLTGMSGVPPVAVSWASSALKAAAAGDKVTFSSAMAQARAAILAQHISMFG